MREDVEGGRTSVVPPVAGGRAMLEGLRRALLRFLADVKSGREEVFAPVYDHQSYDIVPGRQQAVDRPDILVVEAKNDELETMRSGDDR